MKEAVKNFLVIIKQRVQFVGQGKDKVKIRGINHFCPALVYPDFLQDSLAVGTVTVSAGIVMEFHMAAVRALGDVDSQTSGLAVEDGTGGFALDM